ncbi:MAG: hypothetical protein AAF519_00700 [Bacteroidota bacterium]
MVRQLDYAFTLPRGKPTLKSLAIRTRAYRELVAELLAEYESATVVELDGGLTTRYDRVCRPGIKWLNRDDPLKFFDTRIKWCVDNVNEINKWDGNYKRITTTNLLVSPLQKPKVKLHGCTG